MSVSIPSVRGAERWSFGLVTLLLGCSPIGARSYISQADEASVVSFETTRACNISIGAAGPVASGKIHLVDGRDGYELLVVGSSGRGYAVSRYRRTPSGYEYEMKGAGDIWLFSFPDQAGEAGVIQHYERPRGGANSTLPQYLKEECVMESVTFFPEQETQR